MLRKDQRGTWQATAGQRQCRPAIRTGSGERDPFPNPKTSPARKPSLARLRDNLSNHTAARQVIGMAESGKLS